MKLYTPSSNFLRCRIRYTTAVKTQLLYSTYAARVGVKGCSVSRLEVCTFEWRCQQIYNTACLQYFLYLYVNYTFCLVGITYEKHGKDVDAMG